MAELTKEQEKHMAFASFVYRLYRSRTGSLQTMPKWEELPGSVRNKWFSAVNATEELVEKGK